MSFNTYSVCLIPEPRLRRLVTRSGCAFAIVGVVLIWHLPWSGWQLWLATALWIAGVVWQLRRLQCAWRKCRAIRVSPGPTFEVQDPGGDWTPAELNSGSFVLERVAWLRLSTDGGGELSELLYTSQRRCNNWRRLQVIWRHIGAT